MPAWKDQAIRVPWASTASPSFADARSGPLTDALWLIALGALCAGGAEIALILDQDFEYAWLAALYPVVGLVFVGTGVAAWARRPSSRLGFLLVIAGSCILLSALASIDSPVVAAVGAITATVTLAVIIQLLLSFPTGRRRGRVERLVVIAGYGVSLLLQIPIYLYAPAGPLSIADRPDLADAGLHVQRVVGALVIVATATLLVARMRRANREQRRVLVPLSVYGIVALLFIPVSSALIDSILDLGPVWLSTSQVIVIGLVPIVFVLAASRGGFDRTGDLAELGAWLGSDDVGRPELRDALARTLGDPSVQVLFRVPGEKDLVDDMGIPVTMPASANGRATVDVELGGRVVCAIDYDAMLIDRPDEIREAGRVVAIDLQVAGLEERLRMDVETAAFFVVSEAISNSVKHAGPATLAVSLERSDDRLALEVTDGGAGGARAGGGIAAWPIASRRWAASCVS